MILPNAIKTAMNILENGGFECFAVGGCVRDFVMGRIPGDYDLTTNAEPQEMISCFEGFRIIETGIKHGTITVVIDGNNVEITTYRVDGEYKDNRHPEEVRFTSRLSEDLSRRDFTVNAMAYSEKNGLVDLFGGREDIEKKTMRCVGDPDKRFSEDGLRILRALRFASVLDFDIEAKTAESIIRNKNLLDNISRERVFSELTKLICGSGAERVIAGFGGIFEVCFGKCVNPEGISKTPAVPSVRYSALLRDFDDVKSVMRSLRADNKTADCVSKVCDNLKKDYPDEKSVKRLVRDIGADNAAVLGGALRAFYSADDCTAFEKRLETAKKSCCTVSQLDITGSDVIGLGLKGCSVGKALNAALDAVIDGVLENKMDKLSDFVKSMLDN